MNNPPHPPSPQPLRSQDDAVTTTSNCSNPTVEFPPKSNSTIVNGGKPTINKKKKQPKPSSSNVSVCEESSSSSSWSTTSYSPQRGVRVSSRRRNPRVLIGSVRQKESDVEALALPLGMSIAAVVAQVLDRKDVAGEGMSVDHLSMICTLAVRESLTNVFGDKFDCFVRNFEKSFRSTLMTLRLINESSRNKGREHPRHLNKGRYCSEFTLSMSQNREVSACNSGVKESQSKAVPNAISTSEQLSSLEEIEEMQGDQIDRQLSLADGQINQQLACFFPRSLDSLNNQSVLSTFEKSVVEQTHSNNLKTFEIGLLVKKLQLKETQLALSSDFNLLERLKLSMGFSKASFKAEKFKNQLEDSRYAELLKKCIDCLVAGLLIMLVCLGYSAYIYSHKRITDATASCTPSKESTSWWTPKPMASFNSGLQILRCQVQVLSRMLFGLFMILAITYLLLKRSATSNQTMPVTSILLLLGVACGFAGKACINTLGGSGYHWLMYWEVLCLLHLCSNICTSTLYFILNGPISVSEHANKGTLFPYWIRRFLFYFNMLVFLPLACGLMPFASPAEWKDHFSSLVMDLVQTTAD